MDAFCRCTANSREEIKEVRAGDIAAAVGLKDVTTGDTLCDINNVITLERMEFPEPVISVAVEPKTKADQEKMGIALGRLAQEDPSFRVHTDEESGQTIISGHGRTAPGHHRRPHAREFKVEANVGAPQVAYRETIRNTTEVEGKFVRQSGGRGQYGTRVAAHRTAEEERRRATSSSTRSSAASCRRNTSRLSTRASRRQMQNGVLAGYPVLDVKVTLYDGSYHEVDSNEMAFKIAGSMGFKAGVQKAKPVIARADDEGRSRDARRVHGRRDGRSESPPRYGAGDGGLGPVASSSMPRCRWPRCSATPPRLRSATQGRASYSMEFAKYNEVPTTCCRRAIIKKQ